jgi:hypothetical protein
MAPRCDPIAHSVRDQRQVPQPACALTSGDVGKQAGATWFNDFIHPSSIGHEQIARAICERLEGSK